MSSLNGVRDDCIAFVAPSVLWVPDNLYILDFTGYSNSILWGLMSSIAKLNAFVDWDSHVFLCGVNAN